MMVKTTAVVDDDVNVGDNDNDDAGHNADVEAGVNDADMIFVTSIITSSACVKLSAPG